MDEFLKVAIGQGVFCGLFVWLLMDTRKDTKERETKYQNTIEKNQGIIQELAQKFNVVECVKKDVEEIKEKIFK